jgi:hypothetical protein
MRLLPPLGLILIAAMMLLANSAPEGDASNQTPMRFFGPGSFSKPTASAETENAAARQAVERFMSAVNQADRQALRDAIFCDFKVTAQQQCLTAVVDCIAFQRALERAMEERWGEKSIADIASRTRFSAADQAAVKQARVEKRDNGDLMVIPPQPQTPILVRPCSDGKYRVLLRELWLFDSPATDHGNDRSPRHSPEPGSQKRINYIHGVALILRRNAQAVKEGKFQTFQQANAVLEKALQHVAVDPPARDEATDGPEEEAPMN